MFKLHKKYVHTFHSQSSLFTFKQTSLFLPKKTSPQKVSYDIFTSIPTCPLAVIKSSNYYFVSYCYVITIVCHLCQHNKLSLCGPINLLHFDNSKNICWDFV